ncbi:ribosome maturation factor RimP [Dissulfurirhabdus thermomarina]|uniref:Ribosome maturation factor RimP n=1 Tax=Dissulfurirhabdus thermomarina TaxID=1765737 RepID=A0A6N9TPZ6_DISTH|nr:ribosome maturation factor RimP [Dissulfurirhabdus thermomarina]NDY43345.1 ribosome maturation factor RimP [Dissulfurirhabdus thermomarina]NMX23907.1 ribosome maturation factor RimP [Dissulfurirhabdus thermomarina]
MAPDELEREAREISQAVRHLAEPLVRQEGMELVDVQYHGGRGGRLLRLVIDKPGGVTVDDCAEVSRWVGDALDVHDPVPGPYRLEVSSPGINRPLTREADFERFAGEKVLVQLKAPLEGRKTFRGVLEGLSDGAIRLRAVEGGEVRLPLGMVRKARLDIL